MSGWGRKGQQSAPVKYGLNVRAKKPSIFSRDTEADAEVESGKVQSGKSSGTKLPASTAVPSAQTLHRIKAMQEEALATDPTIFDYDAFRDAQQEAESKAKATASASATQDGQRPAARYIGALKQAAEERKLLNARFLERKLLKEEAQTLAENGGVGAGERFVTSAYRELMQQVRTFEADVEEREKRDAEERKRNRERDSGQDFIGFYRQIISARVGQEPHDNNASIQESSEDKVATKEAVESKTGVEDKVARVEDRAGDVSSRRAPETPAVADIVKSNAINDEYTSAKEIMPKVEEKPVAVPEAPVPAKRSEDAVAAARERYLARKRQRLAEQLEQQKQEQHDD